MANLAVLRLDDASGWSILPDWITEGSLSYYFGSLARILVRFYPLQYYKDLGADKPVKLCED